MNIKKTDGQDLEEPEDVTVHVHFCRETGESAERS